MPVVVAVVVLVAPVVNVVLLVGSACSCVVFDNPIAGEV